MTTTAQLKTSRQPKHRIVRDFVLKRMASERLKVGDALPPETSLAESLGVGRNTVRQAMAALTRDGYVQRVAGRNGGAFVTKEVQPSRDTEMGALGLVLPEVCGSFYPSLIKGIGEVAGQAQCSLFICETGNDLGRQGDAILQMIDRRVLGVVMVPATTDPPAHQLRQLEEHDIPVVFCHRGVDSVNAKLVTWSWEQVAQLAAHAIAKHGHRRVAFVADVRYRYTQMYEDAFRSALAEHGIELPDCFVCYKEQLANPVGEDEARSALTSMLSSSNRPTAVFANDVQVGERVYLEALRLGLQVPQDLSIVSFGGKWREGAIREQLSAVVVDEVGLGREAAISLNQIRLDRAAAVTATPDVMPLEFVAGSTLAEVRY